MSVWLRSAVVALVAVSFSCSDVQADTESIAFYYAHSAPIELLSEYQQVVVEPAYISKEQLLHLQQRGAMVFAYLSVGEVERMRPWFQQVKKQWILASNSDWDSAIMDLSNPEWREFLLQKRLGFLWGQGYRAFFLDTLDSYMVAATDVSARKEQAHSLVGLIHTMRKRFPGIKLLLNRGFDVIPEVHDAIVGVAAESLFHGWDPKHKKYISVSEEDREWLLKRLHVIHDQYHLPVTVIDYVPPRDRTVARETARKIADLGFVPWVSTPSLDILGVGMVENVSRRVLLLYDGQESSGLANSVVHQLLAMPLEYMGYAVDYQDVREGLPDYPLTGRYAGVVSWFTDNELSAPHHLSRWLLQQVEAGLKIAIIGELGFEPDSVFLRTLGINRLAGKRQAPIRVRYVNRLMMGFEAKPRVLTRNLTPLHAMDGKGVKAQYSLQDAAGEHIDPVLTAPWGGMALQPYVLQPGLNGNSRWILNPFVFLRQALNLADFPAPDVTTENGRRLLTVHIDGDGAVNRAEVPGTPLSLKVIRDKFLKKYGLPTTVSIIEGEIGPSGLHPELSAKAESLAKSIFSLPSVEVASHSYSHPFDWAKVEQGGEGAGESSYHLPIPGYHFNLERDIDGSVSYINRRLLPAGKSVRVFLWTGDALPGEAALKRVQSLGLANLNGFTRSNREMSIANMTLTNVSPLVRPVGSMLQVYAPFPNENDFTNEWHGPFWGYRNVIQAFRFTGQPQRLKPIGIYYHFYSGSKPASLKALKKVYDWALKQEPFPVWISEYTNKVNDFYRFTISHALDGSWHMRGLQSLRTLRINSLMGWPDLDRSRGVIGVRDSPQGRYISLASSGPYVLYLTDQQPAGPYLESANAVVEKWRRQHGIVHFSLQGHVPLQFSVAGAKGPCRMSWSKGKAAGVFRNGGWHFHLQQKKIENAVLTCS